MFVFRSCLPAFQISHDPFKLILKEPQGEPIVLRDPVVRESRLVRLPIFGVTFGESGLEDVREHILHGIHGAPREEILTTS